MRFYKVPLFKRDLGVGLEIRRNDIMYVIKYANRNWKKRAIIWYAAEEGITMGRARVILNNLISNGVLLYSPTGRVQINSKHKQLVWLKIPASIADRIPPKLWQFMILLIDEQGFVEFEDFGKRLKMGRQTIFNRIRTLKSLDFEFRNQRLVFSDEDQQAIDTLKYKKPKYSPKSPAPQGEDDGPQGPPPVTVADRVLALKDLKAKCEKSVAYRKKEIAKIEEYNEYDQSLIDSEGYSGDNFADLREKKAEVIKRRGPQIAKHKKDISSLMAQIDDYKKKLADLGVMDND